MEEEDLKGSINDPAESGTPPDGGGENPGDLAKTIESLKESEEQFRALFEQSAVGVAKVDPEGSFISVNEKFCSMLGYEREELIELNFRDVTHPDDIHLDDDHISRVMSGEIDSFDIEKRYIRKDGKTIWIRLYSNVVRDLDGDPSYAIAVIVDVTKTKLSEERILYLNDILRSIRNVNQTITKETEIPVLAERVCSDLVEAGGFSSVWIALDHGEETMVAASGLGGNEDALRSHILKNGLFECAAQALAESVTVTIENVSVACSDCPVLPHYREKSAFIRRLEYDNRVYGIITASVSPRYVEDEGTRELFEEVVGDISFALHKIETEDEKKRVVRDLALTRKRLKEITENIHEVFWLRTFDQFLYVSDSVRSIYGVTPEDAYRDPWCFMNSIHEDDRSRLRGAIHSDKFRREGSMEIDYRVRSPDGVTRWIHSRTFPVGKHRGQLKMAGVAEDVTKMKDAELQLKRAKDFSERLMDTANTMIVLLDSNGTILSFNQYAERLTGYDRKEVIGENWTDLFIPEDERGNIGEVFMDVFEGSNSHEGHVNPIMTRSGQRRIIRWSNTTQKGPEGVVEYVLSIGVDVTEEILAQISLKESEERFRSIFNHSPVGIAMVSLDYRIIDPNSTYCTILGYQRDELVGKTIFELTHPDDRETNRTRQEELGAGLNERYSMEKRMIRKDGTIITVKLTANLIHDDLQRPSYFIGTISDITGEKEAMKLLTDERERAEFYLDLLGHDVGNLHQGIFSAFQIARSSHDDRIREMGLSSMEDLIKRSIKLVKNVLLLSRLKEKEPELSRIDLREVLDSSQEQIEKLFPSREITFDMDIPKGQLMVSAEPILEELFINLMHNGIKFQQTETPWLGVAGKRRNDGISISIMDRGCGIPDHAKEKLFSRFSPMGKGSQTGIGLSLVKALAERYEAEIEVKDRVKGDHTQGLEITVRFPREMD